MKAPPIPAEWTDDCQGKMDFDGTLISLSTRFWPRGGGFHLIYGDKIEGNEARPEIKPAAHATIYLGSCENRYYDSAIRLTDKNFEHESEAVVRSQVETWVREEYQRIADALAKLYPVETPE